MSRAADKENIRSREAKALRPLGQGGQYLGQRLLWATNRNEEKKVKTKKCLRHVGADKYYNQLQIGSLGNVTNIDFDETLGRRTKNEKSFRLVGLHNQNEELEPKTGF